MKVSYLPYQPHCFAFGGFEIQMLNTFEAVKSVGVDVQKLNYWDRSSDFEVFHAWGLGTLNYETISWAKKANKKIVITVLLPHQENFFEYIKHWGSYFFHSSKFSKISLENATKIVVLNDIQAKLLNKAFFVSSKKIEIIPNVVNDIYFDSINKITDEGYVLCTGNICKRKNQINLVKACINANQKLVLVGHVLEGEEKYASELETEIKKSTNIKWIKGLKENSQELIDLYLKCKIFALISHSEQQPISALEAMALNKPILLANKIYANQNYFETAYKCNTDVESILSSIKKINYTIQSNKILDCKGINVGTAYKNLYDKLYS